MKKLKKSAVGGFAAALLALAALPQSANANNLVVNGSFEADSQAASTWSIYPNLTGWTGGAAGIELRHNVADAIAALPDRLQLVIQLYFVEELNLSEIAETLQVSIPRVHQLKAQALDKLKAALSGMADVI